MTRSNLVDLQARFVRETDKARQFDFGLDDYVWLPKSRHEWDEDSKTVTLEENDAIEKGLV